MKVKGFGIVAIGIGFGMASTLLMLGILSKGKPPEAFVDKPLERTIETFSPSSTKPEYTTLERDGTEWIQSPYPIGSFGGTLYQASMGEGPKTLNGWASFDGTSGAISSMLSCQAIQTNAHTGEITPWVAREYHISPDKKSIRLTFRKGIRWSDGHPLTVDDLLFTWNTIIKQGLGNPSTRDILTVNGKFPEMVKLDAYTLEVRTTEPYAPLLLNLGQSIAPKHVFEPLLKKAGAEAFGAAWSTEQAQAHPEQFVSCGPWVLKQFVPKERIIFARNPHYYVVNAEGKHLPYIDQEVLTFAKDPNHLQLLFEQGALHTHSVDGENLGRLLHLKKPKFRLLDLGASDGTTFMALNLNNRKTPEGKPIVALNVQRWFQDSRFRMALHHAVNRQLLVDNVLKGLGQPLNTAFGANSIYLNTTLANETPYDVEKAKRLLQAAGFRWNTDGHLLDSAGTPVEFTLTTNAGNTQREDTLVQLQHAFKQLGISVALQPVEFNTLVDRMKTGQWHAMVMGLSGGSNLEPQQSANVFKSDAALHIFNQRTPGKPVMDKLPFEAEIDALYDKGTRYFEVEQRRPIYNRIQEILNTESPMIYLYSPKVILAIRSELQNVDATPLGGALHNIESIYLQQHPVN